MCGGIKCIDGNGCSSWSYFDPPQSLSKPKTIAQGTAHSLQLATRYDRSDSGVSDDFTLFQLYRELVPV